VPDGHEAADDVRGSRGAGELSRGAATASVPQDERVISQRRLNRRWL